MDQSITALTNALKKLFIQLRPQNNPLSFLIVTGKIDQGTRTLLRQSKFINQPVTNCDAKLYYNQHGIIINLNESYINKNNNLLQYALKKLNNCSRYIKITGIILCIDINQLIMANAREAKDIIKSHNQFLDNFGVNLGYKTKLAITFTKLDLLAGFCDFFQNEQKLDNAKPLGFSISNSNIEKIATTFNLQFDHFIETLSQQVINKIHPVRSSIKRTLIREFPLQIASLRNTILPIITGVANKLFDLQAIYFTSGEQGGVSLDRLNKKIQEEYALSLQNKIHHSTNHREYFIRGALSEFQLQTPMTITPKILNHKITLGALSGITILGVILISNQYFTTSNVLNEVSQELLTYDNLNKNNNKQDLATFHLKKAASTIDNIPDHKISFPTIQRLKIALKNSIKQQLINNFIPKLQTDIEQSVNNSNQSPTEKYIALKVYLMLGNKKYYSEEEILSWFEKHWQKSATKNELNRKLSLLKSTLANGTKHIKLNQQIITDARNYLNALPTNYLYYLLIKDSFPKNITTIQYDGFVIGADKIPFYLTKAGFYKTMQELPKLTQQLQNENWVLARQDLQELQSLLQQSYCSEYVIWWQHFIQESHPIHAQTYEDAYTLTKLLKQNNLIKNLTTIIQTETSPNTDLNPLNSLFNQEIASKFSEINLVSNSTIDYLLNTMNEIERFLGTMAVVQDHGKTAFNFTKSRFQSNLLTNPLSALYQQSEQLPKPLSTWTKQIADDIWFALINNSREYLNAQWQQQILQNYQAKIANRYPFDENQTDEISISDFNNFFAKNGSLNNFIDEYLKVFLDTSKAQWQLKEVNGHVLPISSHTINELIRANVITNMFFPNNDEKSQITFSLQIMNLDPIIANLQLTIGEIKMNSNQGSETSRTEFIWPEPNARLVINSIEGKQYEMEELGTWAFFKILQKVNVAVSEEDSSNMQISFEINGNSGKYLLKTASPVNPFIPGILNEFKLPDNIT